MKKIKEMKFHLATGLLLLTYYLIFNVIPDLDFTVALSDEIYYVFHVLQYGWVLTDFIVYAGAGLLFCMLFRYTRSVYWPMVLHILWNTFLIVISLLVFGY